MKGVLISDFSINNLAGYLSNTSSEKQIKCVIAPFNQVHQTLLNDDLDCWKEKPDFAVVWTQPERIINGFSALINFEEVDIDQIFKEVEEFISLLIIASSRVKTMFVATWSIDPAQNYFGILNTKPNEGVVDLLSKINLLLAQKLWNHSNIFLLESYKWISNVGSNAYNPKLWYLNKTPFNNIVFAEAAKEIISALQAISGKTKKLIIADLDNTLWGGVVGDIGYENVKLGGHDPEGEAYKDFQHALKTFTRKGIVLAIASKNDESTALNAIEKNSEMVLSKKDFVAWRINWEDKAQNIVAIAAELNLGLDSIVFIDDSPHERARVKDALPDVFVPEMPSDPLLYKRFILGLDCFNILAISEEDKNRTLAYQEEKQRSVNKKEFSSIDQWLKSIDIHITVEQINKDNFQRVLQLLNKTNQMNLCTLRYTEQDLMQRMDKPTDELLAFSVKDKFGDAGLTGIIGIEYKSESAQITDFVLSCRVIGRKVEETMLHIAVERAKNKLIKTVCAHYIPTDKNKPSYDFFKRSGFVENENTFSWDATQPYKIPTYITIK